MAALLLLARSAQQIDTTELADRVARAGPQAALVLLPALAAAVAQTLGVSVLVRRLGARAAFFRLLRLRLAAEALYASAPAGSAVADAASVGLLGRELGVPAASALAVVAGRKFLVVLANGVYAAIALGFGAVSIRRAGAALGFGDSLLWGVAASVVALLAAAAGGFALAASGSVAGAVRRALDRVPFQAVRAWVAARADRFAAVDARLAEVARMPTGTLTVAGLPFVVSWLLEAFETWLALRLLGAPVTFSDTLAIEVLVSLLRSAAFAVPGGLGVQDAGYVALVPAVGLAGGATLGFAFVFVKRAKDFFWTAIGLLLLLLIGRPLRSEPPSAQSSGDASR